MNKRKLAFILPWREKVRESEPCSSTKKLIDRSTLRQGFQIPVEFHHLLKAMPGGLPKHGRLGA